MNDKYKAYFQVQNLKTDEQEIFLLTVTCYIIGENTR